MTVGDVKFEIEGRDVASERGDILFSNSYLSEIYG